ncbi:MAG TPA: hypothetical protein VHI71_04020 [Actinomycetota bacterium]|nr:hypothetical protein [Actinomycetota bacterium]
MRRIRLFIALTGAVALFSAANSASANHSWEGFHWSRSVNPVNLQVVDSLVGEWDSYLGPAIADWNRSSVVELTAVPGADSIVDRTACLPISGKVRVCNAKYADPTWLGLATVWLNGDHIVQATAQVNDTWFDTELYNDPNAKRHVLCQEIGHDFGLDHTYTEPTCMDDINGLFDPAFVSPGPHDYQQLDAIYAHLDGTGGGTKPKGGPKGGGHKADGGCSGGSCGSTVRVWEEGDLTVVQYVLLAPAAH